MLSLQVDEKQKTVLLTEQGYEDAEEILDVKDLYDPREQWASYVLNAIKAKELFLRDVNYIIRGKEVLIVDEFTGRVMQVEFLCILRVTLYLIVAIHGWSLHFLFFSNNLKHIWQKNDLMWRSFSLCR